MVSLHDHIAVIIFDILTGESSRDSVFQSLDGLLAVHERLDHHAGNFIPALAAVCLADDQFLRNVNHTSGQIAGVSGSKRGIGQTFTCAVRRHEILQHVQTFTEIGLDRQLDGTSCGICHQTTHTCKLFDLLVGTTGPGIRHHINIVIFVKPGEQHFRKLLIRLVPSLHNLTVSLLLRTLSSAEVHGDPVYGSLRFLKHLLFLRRHRHIGNGNGHSCLRGIFIAGRLDQVEHLGGSYRAVNIDDFLKDLL